MVCLITCKICKITKCASCFDDMLDYAFLEKGIEVVCGKSETCNQCLDEITERALSIYQKRETYAQLRERVIQMLGGKCAVCGIDDRRVLQIDHKDGRGAEDRRTYKRGRNSSIDYLNHIIEHTANYQILCANHNWIKRVDNNEHSPRVKRQRR